MRIWALSDAPALPQFGVDEEPPIENWKDMYICSAVPHEYSCGFVRWTESTLACSDTIRSHKADVVGLSWSPDDQMLASCSLSGTVFIHKREANGEFTPLRSLSHEGMIKGIDWDPIGTFLACQGESKESVTIWHTGDWTKAVSLEERYITASLSYFRRLRS